MKKVELAKKMKYEGSKVDNYLDKKMGYKEGGKKDEAMDKKMSKLIKFDRKNC